MQTINMPTVIVVGVALICIVGALILLTQPRRQRKRKQQMYQRANIKGTAMTLRNLRTGQTLEINGRRYTIDERTRYTQKGNLADGWHRYGITAVVGGGLFWLEINGPNGKGAMAHLITFEEQYKGDVNPLKPPKRLVFRGRKHTLLEAGHAFYTTQIDQTGELRFVRYNFGGLDNVRPQLEQFDRKGAWGIYARQVLQPTKIVIIR